MPEFKHVVRGGLRSPADAQAFIGAAKGVRHKGHLKLEMPSEKAYPNSAVPFAAAFQHFQQNGEGIKLGSVHDHIRDAHVLDPLEVSDARARQYMNVVWRYRDFKEAGKLTSGFIDALSETAVCATGVLDSLEWCIFEVLDNVFQHSEAEEGFAMMQIHWKSKLCAVAVADTGIGIHRSFLQAGVHRADNAYEAMKLAVQERVTSKSKNMGNGLYGLIRVVGLGEGQLCIQSGRGHLTYKDRSLSGDASWSVPVLGDDNHGTTVDWQINLKNEVTMQQALPASKSGPASLRLEDIENDEGEHELRVSELEEGVGARSGAEKVRTRLENLINAGARPLTLDFRGVSIVSSSFADEVLGKLALRMGVVTFMQAFRLVNMNPTIQAIVDRAIQQRIAEGDDQTPGQGGNLGGPQR